MFSHEWPLIREIIHAIRQRFPDAHIFAGGEHVSASTEFSMQDCPAINDCVLGDGEKDIGFYRLVGILMFYGLSFLRWPWRRVIWIRNVFGEHLESRLEMSLRDLVFRLGAG